jgi:hypothetical protein
MTLMQVEVIRASAAAGRTVGMSRGLVLVNPMCSEVQAQVMTCTDTSEGKRAFEAASAAAAYLRAQASTEVFNAACRHMDAADAASVLRCAASRATKDRAAAVSAVRWFAAGCPLPRWKS